MQQMLDSGCIQLFPLLRRDDNHLRGSQRLRLSSAATIQSLAIISQATHDTAPAEQAAGYAIGLQWISAWPMHLQIHHSSVQASC